MKNILFKTPKWLFIAFLLSVNLVSAGFMVHESAGYYAMTWTSNSSIQLLNDAMPWIAAVLAETFQHLFMMMTARNVLIQWIFKILVAFLFGATVLAAGYHVLKPMEASTEAKQRQDKLVGVLEQEIQDSREDVSIFRETNQRVNTAKSADARRSAVDRLEKILQKPKTESVESLSQIEIYQLFGLRILIQLSALFCAWKIGSIYREEDGWRKKRKIIREWRIGKGSGFVGIVQFDDNSYLSATKTERRPYKTWRNAVRFFEGTEYEGSIPLQPTRSRV